jgi:murein DD-endopeptidase MepM/ murein hydrolase activator NlpD
MRDKTTITITTYKSSKSYTIGEMTKIAIRYFIYGVALLFLIFSIVIYMLSNDIKEYDHIADQNFDLINKNILLEADIAQQLERLSAIENMVSHIETLIGKEETEVALDSRIDIANITLSERSLMLKLIPNGSPIKDRGTTSKYEWRTNPISKKRQYHAGIDMRAKMNTPIYAPADGIVEIARKKKKGFGNLIILNHYIGFKTLYGHLRRIKVKTGDYVKKGQLIGLTGNSGNSNGPHLHYEVHYISRSLNPKYFNEWSLENYDTIFKKVKRVHWDNIAKGLKWQWIQQKQLLSLKEPSSVEKSK